MNNEQLLLAELGATQVMLLALINTHPDPASLLGQFDHQIAQLQLFAVEKGSGQFSQSPLYPSIQRYRLQIAEAVAARSPPTQP